MLKVKIPNNNLAEREYIIDVIFDEFLGLDYILEPVDGLDSWVIELNGKKLTVKDSFFNRFPKELEYLKLENIPKRIEELDIFAASFFMLTRWEEYVNPARDKHNRFPANKSLAFRQGFLNKPIVNEYVERLKEQLLEMESGLKFKKREFKVFITHDVDEIYFWKGSKQLARVVLGDIVKRKDLSLALNRIKEFISVKSGKISDPYDTFDWLMSESEKIGAKSRFYFMSGGVTQYDNRYKIDEKKALNLIEKIKKRGHIIGIHPSYNAYNSFEQFKSEKDALERACKCKIDEGREHYLRFSVPITWQIWEDNSMRVDSSCCYADSEGFRCGTGDEFSVFNILTRKKLKLKERPLVFMDDNFYSYKKPDFTEAKKLIKELFENAKRYNSQITILFHNSIFYGKKNIDFKKLYKEILELK